MRFTQGMDGPCDSLERAWRARGYLRVAGVDEAGRGPLAGPVTAAAVVLDPDCIPDGLNDSKQLTAAARERLFDALMSCAIVSVAHASVEEIDRLNILRASHLAMLRALSGLVPLANCALIDGNMLPDGIGLPCEAVVGGDRRALCIAAASIVAKVTRDRLMRELAREFPGYGWETNVGYASKAHRDALQGLGVTPHHRRSFAPVHNILCGENLVSS